MRSISVVEGKEGEAEIVKKSERAKGLDVLYGDGTRGITISRRRQFMNAVRICHLLSWGICVAAAAAPPLSLGALCSAAFYRGTLLNPQVVPPR